MFRAFLKDSVIYAIPALLSRGLSLFLVPLYTRVLSPADYGSLDLLTVFAGIINLTIALEISQGVARFYTGEPDPVRKVRYASTAFWFTLACYSVFALLMLSFTGELAHRLLGQPDLENAFRIGILFIWAGGLFYLVQNQLRWELRSKQYAIVSLVMTFVAAGSSVWFAYGLRWGLEGMLLGMLLGNLAGLLLGLWWLRGSFRLQFDAALLGEMLTFSTPLVFSGLAVWASLYIDRIMINHFLSVEEVGLYGIGHRLASIAGLVMIGFQSALTPLIYTYYREADTPVQLAKIFRMFVLFSIIVFLGLSLFAIDILKLLTTEAFYGGSVVVIYLVPAILLANMYIFAPGIGIAKKTHLVVWINLSGALLSAALNYFFIPRFGITGAAASTLFSYCLVFSLYMVASQRFYAVPHRWKPIGFVVALAALVAFALPQFALNDWLRWSLGVTAIFGTAGLAIMAGLILPDELRQAHAWARARLARNATSNH